MNRSQAFCAPPANVYAASPSESELHTNTSPVALNAAGRAVPVQTSHRAHDATACAQAGVSVEAGLAGGAGRAAVSHAASAASSVRAAEGMCGRCRTSAASDSLTDPRERDDVVDHRADRVGTKMFLMSSHEPAPVRGCGGPAPGGGRYGGRYGGWAGCITGWGWGSRPVAVAVELWR